MRIVKPLRVSLLQRTLTLRRENRLAIGVVVYFQFDSPDRAMTEPALWQMVPTQVGKDAPLDEGLPKPRGEFLVYGHAFAPGGKPRPAFAARVDVGALSKTVYVVGP